MRRLALELTPSRAALWSRRLALFGAAVALIAVGIGRVEPVGALAALGTALVFALAAAVLALAAFAVIWNDGRPGIGAAIGGLTLALTLLAFPAYLAAEAFRLPRLNDVTTDLVDPPSFSRSRQALTLRGGRIPPDPPAATRALQQSAYPFVAPILLDVEPEIATALALKAAANLGWQVYETAPLSQRTGIGRIEAVDRTPLLRFADDITIRLRPQGIGTRVDIRSASRLGTHDLGVNAKRIRHFADELSALADDALEPGRASR